MTITALAYVCNKQSHFYLKLVLLCVLFYTRFTEHKRDNLHPLSAIKNQISYSLIASYTKTYSIFYSVSLCFLKCQVLLHFISFSYGCIFICVYKLLCRVQTIKTKYKLKTWLLPHSLTPLIAPTKNYKSYAI